MIETNDILDTSEIDTLKEHHDKRGVVMDDWEYDGDGILVATAFNCHSCGLAWRPPAEKVKGRHICPNGCNRVRRA
jgi:hypothetical protein